MKTSNTRCRILYRNSSYTWDILSPLTLGNEFVLEVKNGKLLVRDFTRAMGEKSKLLIFPFLSPIQQQKLEISINRTLKLSPIFYPDSISEEKVRNAKPISIGPNTKLNPEDETFRKGVRRILEISALLCLIVIVSSFFEKVPETNEELIPQKYAKLLLTKPKPEKSEPASGVSARSQAQTKAIARAFQSTTIQKSMKSILQGGLSKYSVMATGKSIQNLSEKMLSQTNAAGTGLEKKTNSILGAMNTGNQQIGSADGYGSGTGTNVKGQGNGHLSIGLNLKDATVDEGLTKEEVAKVIQSHMSEIRYCYESAVLNNPALAGKVLIDFKIGGNGSVATAQTGENTMGSNEVSNCLAGKLKNWKFPNPRGGVTVAVSYPFIFKSLTR